jgi:hypothetical protein
VSKHIWKYKFRIADEVHIETTRNSIFLDVQMQDGVPCMWFIVDDEEPKEIRDFVIYGTGHPVPDGEQEIGIYRGTFMEYHGGLVWHIFEV